MMRCRPACSLVSFVLKLLLLTFVSFVSFVVTLLLLTFVPFVSFVLKLLSLPSCSSSCS
jgi:hypothetical protein